MTMKDIVIFGANQFSRTLHYYVTTGSDMKVVAFTADSAYIENDTFLERPLIDFDVLPDLFPPSRCKILIGIGYSSLNKLREEKFHQIKSKGYELANFIHPSTRLPENTKLGEHVLIFEDNTIQPFVEIGDNVVLWSKNILGHDSVIEDHCFITSATKVGGGTRVGSRSMLGIGSLLKENIRVGEDCLIGAGAVILSDTANGGIYGVPSTERSPAPSSKLKI